MKALNHVQRAGIEKAAEAIRKTRDELDAAVEKFNARNAESLVPVEAAIDKLNAALIAAAEWRDGVTQEMERYAVDRSERWRESEAGQNFKLWKDQFLGLFLDEIELEKPDDLEIPDTIEPEEILELPDQPG